MLSFALNNAQELVNIEVVANGLACNCTCPSCGKRLEARNKGLKRDHFFAHDDGNECAHGAETALHLLAKQIIKETKTVFLAEYPLFKVSPIPEFEYFRAADTCVFDRVELEVLFPGFVPDVVGYIGERKLLIEVRVTHAVDDEKRKRVRAAGFSMIELDLSEFSKKLFRADEVAAAILAGGTPRAWISLPIAEARKEELLKASASHTKCPHGLGRTPPWSGSGARSGYLAPCFMCKFLLVKESGQARCLGHSNVSSVSDLRKLQSGEVIPVPAFMVELINGKSVLRGLCAEQEFQRQKMEAQRKYERDLENQLLANLPSSENGMEIKLSGTRYCVACQKPMRPFAGAGDHVGRVVWKCANTYHKQLIF